MFLSVTQHFREVVSIQVKLLICNMVRQPVEQRNALGWLANLNLTRFKLARIRKISDKYKS